MKKLTHIDEEGKMKMVDVSKKSSTLREAMASGSISMEKETLSLITGGKIAKGNVLDAARLAGIMAAKKTCELIPLCHQINLSTVSVDFKIDKKKNRINIESKAKCKGETGVEMEALVAASTAALTIYDMCKAVDKGMVISDIMLLKKTGGKSGKWERK